MKYITTASVCALALSSLLLAPAPALAQTWPAKPVKIIASSGAGGAADIVAWLIAERLSPALGQPVIVDNKPGVGGHLGAEMVARSPADGYTLLMSGSPDQFAEFLKTDRADYAVRVKNVNVKLD
jgi:tripartite-type tricarboxylate transporter receptor subunit TctC